MCTFLHVTVYLCCTVGIHVWLLTECCLALAPPQQRQKAQSDGAGAAVEPWAARPHIALCRCPPGCVLLTPKWAEGGKEKEKCTFLCIFKTVFPPSDLIYIVLPSHLGIWAAGCRVVCSRQMAAPCLLCRSASNARIPNHQTWTCCRSLWAGGDTWKTDVVLLSCDVCHE